MSAPPREISMLFTGPMVRAIIDGRKTMTRRVRFNGKPGDRILVRETTYSYLLPDIFTGEPTDAMCGAYMADDAPVLDELGFALCWWYSRKVCPSIHMPRFVARIILEVADVRERRLQKISEDDAVLEGTEYYLASGGKQAEEMSIRAQFMMLWDSIYAERGYGWVTNPPVKVVSFRRVDE